MSGDRNLMPIGRFAASCRLSIKALRHYDEQGLLQPAYVDPNTGYRYYRREQARTAVTISMLRSLDCSLATIGQLLQAPSADVESILQRQADKLQRELARKQQAMAAVQRLTRERSLLPHTVSFRTEPERLLIARTIQTSVDELLPDSTSAIVDLLEAVSHCNARAPQLVMCINEMPQPCGAMSAHVCVDLEPGDARPDNCHELRLGSGPVAWCLHQGAYEELGLAYHAVYAALQVQGHEQSGAMREIYLNDPATTPVEQLLTEVMVPIA